MRSPAVGALKHEPHFTSIDPLRMPACSMRGEDSSHHVESADNALLDTREREEEKPPKWPPHIPKEVIDGPKEGNLSRGKPLDTYAHDHLLL